MKIFLKILTTKNAPTLYLFSLYYVAKYYAYFNKEKTFLYHNLNPLFLWSPIVPSSLLFPSKQL